MRQLTFGGDNAEAYFSKDGKYLIFQKTDPKNGIMCDQIWMGKVPTKISEKFEPKLISNGTGRTTCPFFYPDGKSVLYASTHLSGNECPPVPDRAKYGNKYIWPIYESMDIFQADLKGKNVKTITNMLGYDGGAWFSYDGKKIIGVQAEQLQLKK